MEFSSWLKQELIARGWSRSDLLQAVSRQGHKIAASQLSFILNNARLPSPETCIAIAAGLDLPREEVFRARGWLLNPSQELTNIDPRAERVARRVSALPAQSREIALDAIEPMLESVYKLTQIREAPAEYES